MLATKILPQRFALLRISLRIKITVRRPRCKPAIRISSLLYVTFIFFDPSSQSILFQNKWELVDDRKLDEVLDHLHTLNDLTPKIRCQGRNGVDPNLIFGVESKLFLEVGGQAAPSHNDEVETVSLYAGYGQREKHQHNDHCHCLPGSHTPAAIDQEERSDGLDEEVLTIALGALSKESIWRVKGLVRLRGKGMHILNWAFGRFELTALGVDSQEQGTVKLTVSPITETQVDYNAKPESRLWVNAEKSGALLRSSKGLWMLQLDRWVDKHRGNP